MGEGSSIEIEGLREDESLTSGIATNEIRVNMRSGLEGKKSSPTGNCDRKVCGNRIWSSSSGCHRFYIYSPEVYDQRYYVSDARSRTKAVLIQSIGLDWNCSLLSEPAHARTSHRPSPVAVKAMLESGYGEPFPRVQKPESRKLGPQRTIFGSLM